MKKRKLSFKYLFLALLLLWGLVYFLVRVISPDIILINQTDKVMYIYTMQSIAGDDPSDAEVAQLKRVRVIQSGKQLRLSVFLSNLFTKQKIDLGTGWRIGSQVAKEAKVGSKLFLLNRHEGSCRIKIEIQEGSYNVIPVDQLYCYKKLKMPEQ